VAKTKEILWFHTASDHKLSMKPKKQDQLRLFVTSSESLKGLFKQQILQKTNLVPLVKMLCKWFTAMSSKGKPVIGPLKTETLMSIKQLIGTHSLRGGGKTLKNQRLKDISKWNTRLVS